MEPSPLTVKDCKFWPRCSALMAIKQWGFLRILILLIILVFRDPEEPIQNSKCSLIMVIYACLYKNMSSLKSPLLNRFLIYVQILPTTKNTWYFLWFILKLSNASYTSLWLNCIAYLASGFTITNFVFWSQVQTETFKEDRGCL